MKQPCLRLDRGGPGAFLPPLLRGPDPCAAPAAPGPAGPAPGACPASHLCAPAPAGAQALHLGGRGHLFGVLLLHCGLFWGQPAVLPRAFWPLCWALRGIGPGAWRWRALSSPPGAAVKADVHSPPGGVPSRVVHQRRVVTNAVGKTGGAREAAYRGLDWRGLFAAGNLRPRILQVSKKTFPCLSQA